MGHFHSFENRSSMRKMYKLVTFNWFLFLLSPMCVYIPKRVSKYLPKCCSCYTNLNIKIYTCFFYKFILHFCKDIYINYSISFLFLLVDYIGNLNYKQGTSRSSNLPFWQIVFLPIGIWLIGVRKIGLQSNIKLYNLSLIFIASYNIFLMYTSGW